MGWETRKGRGRYYCRSVWAGGRVRRQYLGTGPEAERAAAEDQRRRAEQRARRDAARAEVARLDAADAPLAEFREATDLLLRAALTAGGYHQHAHGGWRRRKDVAAD